MNGWRRTREGEDEERGKLGGVQWMKDENGEMERNVEEEQVEESEREERRDGEVERSQVGMERMRKELEEGGKNERSD